MEQQFSPISIHLSKIIDKETKKKNGIYFTPNSIIKHMCDNMIKYVNKNITSEINKIIDPACGSCEFFKYLNHIPKFSENTLFYGIETNATILNAIQTPEFTTEVIGNNATNKLTILNADGVTNHIGGADIVIGNPPYCVVKKQDTPKQYDRYIVGRSNTFCLFILSGLDNLKVGGLLNYVVPSSFLNSSYYSQIRKLIKETCEILTITDYTSEQYNEFIDTQQPTIGILLRKNIERIDNEMMNEQNEKNGIIMEIEDCEYSIYMTGTDNVIFSPNASEIRELFNGSTTIANLGLKVKTGTVVWNQRKEDLTDDSTKTLLIYNTNVAKTNSLAITSFKNGEKKQYINDENGKTEGVLVVNRGNGNAQYKLSYALVDGTSQPYLVENHLNVIYGDMSLTGELYAKIIASFNDSRTTKFIELFLGNNGLSKTELERIFPIWV